MTSLPDFPGAVGLSQLEVYPWPTADHEHGGSPHMHLACAECYVVVSGRGRLETLDYKGLTTTELHPGDVVCLRTPGGGGYGPPSERDPQLVRRDVDDGYITEAEASELYGRIESHE